MRLLRGMSVLLSVGLLQCTSVPAARSEESVDPKLQSSLQWLEREAQKRIDDHAVAGLAVAVVHDDKVVFSKGFGSREVGKPEKIDADTVFQLASVSKSLGATVMASAVGDGKVSWDSKICELDPEFRMYEPFVSSEITIRDLYAHKSGLPDHAGDLLEDIGYNRQQVLHRLRYQRPESSFRSHYAYTNFGLTEAAVAAAKACGQSWEDLSAERLYKPLGMTSTSSRYSDFIARSNKALGHVLVDGMWVQKYVRQPDAQSPAGGASSSVNDMAKWIRCVLAKGKFDGKQVIPEAQLKMIETPNMFTAFSPLSGLPGFYGLGMNVGYDERGRLRLGHSGGFAMGNATVFNMVPDEKIGVVVLTNSAPRGVAEGLASSFLDEALEGKQTQDWFGAYQKAFADPVTLGLEDSSDYTKSPNAPSSAKNNDAYLGAYNNDLYGEIAIVEKDGKLAIVEGPNKMTFTLKHFDRDTFTYVPPGENSNGDAGVTFTIGPKGKALSVTVENLNEQGQGVFARSTVTF